MSDLHQYLIDEVVEDYNEGYLTRRRALQMLVSLVGAAVASQVLDAQAQPTQSPKPSTSPKTPGPATSPHFVPEDDPAIKAEIVEFQSGDAKVAGYFARPAKGDKFPLVLVCHENRGLTLHTQDVTRRFAKAGIAAISVDLISREGGTAKHEYDAIPGILGKVPPERHVQDFQSALKYVQSRMLVRGKEIAMVGFCFGGGVTWKVAAATPEIKAAVPFYGTPLAPADVPKLHAAVLGIYAGKDERINKNIGPTEEAMKKEKKKFEKIVYPNVDHAFHNDTGERYNANAAKDAWEKTLAFIKANTKG